MRLKKQSMKQVADAGLAQHYQTMVDTLVRQDPLTRAPVEKPRFYRGARVKPKQETETDGD